jgi:hypothetical protein
MATPQAAQVTDHFREVNFEIQRLAQEYVASGEENADIRNAIRGLLMLNAGLREVLTLALQRG